MLFNSYKELIKDKSIIEEIHNLNYKYDNYLNISRFSIPIIGLMSVGKSTLLNYLLQLRNFLEMGIEKTTSFFCIIRHNKNYQEPVISNVKIEKRHYFKYNFIKSDEIEYDENFINIYNNNISEIEDLRNLKIENFFKLIEVDIPLFHGDFEKYADLIEFIDIPGLDEYNIYLKDFYISQVFPFIQPNYLFAIFLFDNEFEKGSNEILKKFKEPPNLECVYKNSKIKEEEEKRKFNQNKVFKNSLFILNNKVKNEANIYKIFESFLKINHSINCNITNNCYELDLKEKNLKLNKFNSFEDYLDYIMYNFKSNSGILNILIDKINKDFRLKLNKENINKNIYPDNQNTRKKQLKHINQIIKNNGFAGKLNMNQYNYFIDIFSNYSEINEQNKYINKDSFTNKVKRHIELRINDYLQNEIYELKQKIIKILEKNQINLDEEKEKNYIEQNLKKKKLNSPKELIDNIKTIINKLSKLGDYDDNSNRDKKHPFGSIISLYQSLVEFSKTQLQSSFLLIGEMSSGKSTLINNLIGYNLNLLETKSSECTEVAIIIRYTKNISDIELVEAEYKKEKFRNYFTPENKESIRGKENVINKIIKLNKEKEFKYYILKTPIQALDELGLPDFLKEKIEFIDFPGLGSGKNSFIKEKIKELLTRQNAFIFVKDGKEFKKSGANEAMKLIYEETIKKDIIIISNCLFLFTHVKKNNNYDMKELKAKLIKTFEEQTIEQCFLKKKENEDYIKENNLIISTFEKSFYDDYLIFSKKIDNFSDFTNTLIDEFKERYDKYSIENIIEYLNDSKYINEEKYDQYKILNENDGYIDQLENILTKESFQTNKKKMKLFVELYLKIKNNKKLHIDYENSHYEDMLQSIGKIIKNVELMINSTLTSKIKNFSISVFSYFDNFKKLILESNIDLTKEDQSFFNNIIYEIKDNIK